MPYRFSDAASGPVRGVPEPGEHTEDILRDWTGRPDLPAPSAPARLLAERRSHTIGVLLNDLRQPWFADMLDGLTPALHAGGKHILLGDGRIDRMLDETLTWSFIDLGVDGLVLAGSIPMSQAIIDAASQIPTVAVGGRGLDVDLPRADILANDNHLGGTLPVRHLIELGHTRIAHIHGLPTVAAGRRGAAR